MLIKKEVLEVLNQSSDKKNNSYDLILFHLDRLEEIKFD
jgi:hypothetical protein